MKLAATSTGLVLILFCSVQGAEKTVDPSGSWRFTDEQGLKGLLKLDLVGKDKVVGIYRRQGGEDVKITDGQIRGKQLTLAVDLEVEGGKVHSELTCTVEGDKFSGQSEYSGDFGSGVSPITARRSVLAEDVVGKWKLAFTTPEGDHTAEVNVALDGKQLDCEYRGDGGAKLQAERVSVKDNVFAFAIESPRDGDIVKVTFRGRPYGNKISGSFEYDFQGNVGEIEFTGKRTPSSP